VGRLRARRPHPGRDGLVASLTDAGLSADYDGDSPGVVSAAVAGADDTLAGDGTADGLVDPGGITYDFGAGADIDQADDQGEADDTGTPPDSAMMSDDGPEPFSLEPSGQWEGVLIVEGMLSGDNRLIEENALSWRDLPIPLMAMFRNPDGGEGHDGAELCGAIEWVDRRGAEIWGGGHLDLGGAAGREAYRLMGGPVDAQGKPSADGERGPVFMRGVSADLDRVEVTWENQLGDDAGIEDLLGFDPGTMHVIDGRLMGATLVQFPSFMEATVSLVDGSAEEEVALAASAGYTTWARVYTPWSTDALVASAGAVLDTIPVAPPGEWFARPSDAELTELRALGRAWRITDEGRIYGFAAVYGTLHIGRARPTEVPRSPTGYAHYRTGETHCADGSVVATGPLVMDCVHPDLTWQASDAATFYHHTGAGVGDLAVWDDEEAGGIVFAGALRPGVTNIQLRTLRGSDGVSPDWRKIGGKRDMVAMLVVNNSGFKTAALVASSGEPIEAGKYVVPGTFKVAWRQDEPEPLAMVAAGSFAVRKPVADAAITQLASVIAGMRLKMQELEVRLSVHDAERRTVRASRAIARLGPTRQALLAARANEALGRLAE
jgi:hypothetical protein